MIIMCLRFVIFWILVNGLITPFGSPVSRGTETVQIVSCISHVARYVNSLLTPFGSPVSRGTETLSNFQFVLENNLKI